MKSIRFDEIRIPDSALAGDAVVLMLGAGSISTVAHQLGAALAARPAALR